MHDYLVVIRMPRGTNKARADEASLDTLRTLSRLGTTVGAFAANDREVAGFFLRCDTEAMDVRNHLLKSAIARDEHVLVLSVGRGYSEHGFPSAREFW